MIAWTTFGPMMLDYVTDQPVKQTIRVRIGTYSTICDPKQTEEHIFISSRRHLRHHGLSICVIWSLKQAKEDIVNPEIPDTMVPYSVGPKTQHAIEWYEHAKCVGNHEHVLSFDPKIFLEVPEAESGERRASCLGKTEIGNFKEREGYNIVLNNRDECPSGIQPVCQKKKRDQVYERLREMSDLAQSEINLLPANSGIAATFGNLGPWARLLVNKPPDSKYHPVCFR
jgi:hypothetical protein